MRLEGDETLLEDGQRANNIPRSRISLYFTIKFNESETLTDYQADFLSGLKGTQSFNQGSTDDIEISQLWLFNVLFVLP